MSGNRIDRFAREQARKAEKLARQLQAPGVPSDRAAMERDLFAFGRAAWPILEPARPFVANWHHELLAEYLTAAAHGDLKRLIINIPPRHTKSRMVTVLWPCWVWAQRPATDWIFGSYSGGLSVDHSIERRTVLSSDWFQHRWGDRVMFAADENLKTTFANTQHGRMTATSVGGTVFGMGADFIVIDDPHSPEQTLSEAERDTALRWFDQTLSTRLNDPATGVIVVVMQRLHQQDLTGHLLEQGGWAHVALPAEAEERERIVFPVSKNVHERAAGDLLWPSRFTADVLTDQKRRMGSWAYAGHYQQRPTPLGGGIFRRDWWRFYDEPPEAFDQVIASWDLAFKDTAGADFVVGQVWGAKGADKYLLDQVRGRWSFPATVQAIRALAVKWPQATAKLVEDKANGPAVIATLQHEVPGLIAVNPEGGKIARAQAVSPEVEAGNVYLPLASRHPWVAEFIEECAAFPTAAHDDQVDAMTQALRRLAGSAMPQIALWMRAKALGEPIPTPGRPKKVAPTPAHTGVVSTPTTRWGPTAEAMQQAIPALCPQCQSRLVVIDSRDSYGRVNWRCGQCAARGTTSPPTAQDRARYRGAGLLRDSAPDDGRDIGLAEKIDAMKFGEF